MKHRITKELIPVCCSLLLALAGGLSAAESPRYGAEGFLPTPQTPIGFQADGSGWYPGAKLDVLEWWDGTPGVAKVGTIDNPKPGDQPVFLDKTPKNILWKVPLPGHAGNHPIVVGDRVIVTVWPDFTICYDRITGKELWRDRLPATALPVLSKDNGCTFSRIPDPTTARKNETLYGMAIAMNYLTQALRNSPAESDAPGPADYPRVKLAVERLCEWRKTLEPLEPSLVPLLDREIDLARRFLAGEHDLMGRSAQADKELREKLGKSAMREVPQFGVPEGNKPYFTGEILKLTGLSLNNAAWGSMLSLHLAVPASDGTVVVVRFANGQIGAYEVATGRLLWAWRDPWCDTGWTWHCFSPRVHGDAVFMNLVGGYHNALPKHTGLYCVDVKTGAIRWSLPHKKGTFAVHGNTYPTTTPVAIDLPDGAGGTMAIVANCMGEIVSAKDGKVLHRFPDKHHMSAAYPFAVGDRLYASGLECENVSGGSQGQMGIYQPSLAQGTLRMPLLETIPMVTYYGVSVCNDRLIIGGNKSHYYDLQTKTLGPCPAGWTGMAIIGDRYLRMSADQGINRRSRLDGITTESFEVFDARPRPHEAPRRLPNRGLLGGAEQPADIYHDTYLAGLDKLPLMQGKKTQFGNSFMAYFGHLMGGPAAAGNRMYVQGACYLYCIGPAVQGTPADDPKVVAAIRAAKSADEVAKYLESGSAQYRYEAARRCSVFKVQGTERGSDPSTSSLNPEHRTLNTVLQRLALDDPYEEIRAAAIRSLDAWDPAGNAGWNVLVESGFRACYGSDVPWNQPGHREQQERRKALPLTFLAMGETDGIAMLARRWKQAAQDPVQRRGLLAVTTTLRWRVEPMFADALAALREPQAWPECRSGLGAYFLELDAAGDPVAAEILVKAFPRSWEMYPTFARHLKPEALLAWIEGSVLAEGVSAKDACQAWKSIGPAAKPSMQKILATWDEQLKKLEADGKKNPGLQGNRDTLAKAMEETIAIIKEK
jgi:outer membrane protein assembly factor BamB